jgi:Glycosyltransferase family 87
MKWRQLSGYKSFFVAGATFLLLVQLLVVVLGFPGGLAGRADFRILYAAGHMVRTGDRLQLYDYEKIVATESELAGKTGATFAFVHPAYEALLFVPLSLLSYKNAYLLFFFCNIALVLIVFRLLVPNPGWLGEIWTGLPAMMVIGFLPVGICLIQGQDSIVLSLIVACAYVLQLREKDFAAGLILGLGLFRFQLVLPIVLCLSFLRRWKLLAGFALTLIAVVCLSAAVAGPSSLLSYPGYIMSMDSGLDLESQRIAHGTSPYAMPNLRGLLFVLLKGRISENSLFAITFVASAALVIWALTRRLRLDLVVMVALLVSFHGSLHDSVLMLLPLLHWGITATGPPHKRLLPWIMLFACPTLVFVLGIPLAFLALAYGLSLVAMERWGPKEWGSGRAIPLPMTNKWQRMCL